MACHAGSLFSFEWKEAAPYRSEVAGGKLLGIARVLKGLDHVNISTPDMGATLAFFEDMLGLRAEAAPGQDAARNSWLYDPHGNAIVHVNLRQGANGEGPIHHAAFACTGYDAMRDRLVEAGHAFREIDNRAVNGARQIFVHSPDGALIELNFRAD